MTKEELEKLESEFLSNTFRFCNTCFKTIDKTEPHIAAYKNGYKVYFCRNHVRDAEHYLDWFQEFVELK